MQASLIRATKATGMTSFSDLASERSSFVVLVTAPGCTHCASFETEYRDAASEVAMRKHSSDIYHWKCETQMERDVALHSGVDDVPCIAIVHPTKSGGGVELVDAFRFSKGQ